MIELAPFLPPSYCRSLEQTRLFLANCDTGEANFVLTPEPSGACEAAFICGRYADRGCSDGIYATDVTITTEAGKASFRTDLHDAVYFIEGVADRAANVEELKRFDPNQPLATAAARYGVDAANLVTRGIGSRHTDHHITKWRGRYLLYLVDTYGSTVPLASSETPALLVYVIHVSKRRTADDIAGRSVQLWEAHRPEDFVSRAYD